MNRKNDKSYSLEASEFNHQSYKDGCTFYNSNKFSKAATLFKEALEYWPEDYQAWLALGNCYDELNKPKKAESCFLKALSFCGENDQDKLNYNLGNSLFDQEKYQMAIDCYLKVHVDNSDFVQAKRNIDLAKKIGNLNK